MCFMVKLGGLFHISDVWLDYSCISHFSSREISQFFFLQTFFVFCQYHPSVIGGYHELIGNSTLMAGHTFHKYLIYALP